MAPEAQQATTWAQAAMAVGFFAGFALIISFMIPIPWMMLAAWLESRHEIKITLAKARLLEAQNAAKAAPLPDSDTGGCS